MNNKKKHWQPIGIHSSNAWVFNTADDITSAGVYYKQNVIVFDVNWPVLSNMLQIMPILCGGW